MHLRFQSVIAAMALSAGLALSPAAISATASEGGDTEEQLDQGLKGFGYLTGLALGCVASEQRTRLEREALDLNAEITRLFGTDRAFLFAASFGNGTGVELKTEDCKTVIDRYSARVVKFRQGRGNR